MLQIVRPIGQLGINIFCHTTHHQFSMISAGITLGTEQYKYNALTERMPYHMCVNKVPS